MTAPALSFAPRSLPYESLVLKLVEQLRRANYGYERYDRYYTGDQPLSFMAPEVASQVGDRLTPMVVNWAETIVDSVNRRLSVEGFQLGADAAADDDLWRIFTVNGLDEDAPLGQADALVHGLGFLSVWGNDEDPATPLMAFESAHQVAVRYRAGSGDRLMDAAIKTWASDDTAYRTLYLPDEVIRFAADVTRVTSADGSVQSMPTGIWRVDQRLENPLGAVPMAAMVNHGRLLNRAGRSELASVAPIVDGINKLATDMMVTSEFYQSPRRYATGIQIPSGVGDVERLQAEATAMWEEATKKKVWLAGPGVEFGQFQEAQLDGFVKAINLLTASLAAIGGLPPDDLGLNTTNPASAEARRAAETTLVLRAGEKQRAMGAAYGRAMRLAVAARDGLSLAEVPAEYARMRVVWKDPATPAIAQSMDAAVKGKEAGIYDTEAAQETVGMGPVERAAVAARAAEAQAQAATADVRARMDLARELQSRDGLSQNAALAAVGLLAAANANTPSTAAPAPAA